MKTAKSIKARHLAKISALAKDLVKAKGRMKAKGLVKAKGNTKADVDDGINCVQAQFLMPDGTYSIWGGIYDTEEQAHRNLANPIREHIAPSTQYRLVKAIWPRDWRSSRVVRS